MAVRVNVKKNLNGIPVRVDKMKKIGQYALVNQVHADMNNYVPLLRADLRNQSTISLDAKSILWNAPYARRRFYEPAVRYTTPGTTARWDLKAKSIHTESWIRVTERAMK